MTGEPQPPQGAEPGYIMFDEAADLTEEQWAALPKLACDDVRIWRGHVEPNGIAFQLVDGETGEPIPGSEITVGEVRSLSWEDILWGSPRPVGDVEGFYTWLNRPATRREVLMAKLTVKIGRPARQAWWRATRRWR